MVRPCGRPPHLARNGNQLPMHKQAGHKGVQLKFYVYEHWRPDTNECFYVGKGQGRRCYKIKDRNKAYNEVCEYLAGRGLSIEVRLIKTNLDEKQAFDLEKERISFWRGSNIVLCNRTDGGDGFSGFVRPLGILQTPQSKARLSLARKGIVFSPEHRANLAKKKRGVKRKPFTEQTILKMKAASLERERKKREKFGAGLTRWSRLRGLNPSSETKEA